MDKGVSVTFIRFSGSSENNIFTTVSIIGISQIYILRSEPQIDTMQIERLGRDKWKQKGTQKNKQTKGQ